MFRNILAGVLARRRIVDISSRNQTRFPGQFGHVFIIVIFLTG